MINPSRSLAVAAAALFTAGSASAATLTITSGPTFDTPEVVSTITGQLLNGNLVKVSGNASFVQPGAPISAVTMTLTGTFSATRGDVFTLAYEFTGSLTGAIGLEVGYSLEVDLVANTGFGPISVNNVAEESGTFTPTSGFKADEDSAEIPSEVFDTFGNTLSGTFTARLILNTSNMVAGNSMSLAIPTNSIDFSVAPVPEPSGLALVVLGAAGIGLRRRR